MYGYFRKEAAFFFVTDRQCAWHVVPSARQIPLRRLGFICCDTAETSLQMYQINNTVWVDFFCKHMYLKKHTHMRSQRAIRKKTSCVKIERGKKFFSRFFHCIRAVSLNGSIRRFPFWNFQNAETDCDRFVQEDFLTARQYKKLPNVYVYTTPVAATARWSYRTLLMCPTFHSVFSA